LHEKTAVSMGVSPNNILVLDNGDTIELRPNSMIQGQPVKSGIEMLDNTRTGIVDARALKERQQLADDGIVTILIPISTDGNMAAPPRVSLRGVVTSADPRKMSLWTEKEIVWVLENRWKQLSRQTGPKKFEVDWIGVQREIESGLNRRMRRELQVEPLILCLVQPAPSGTPAYRPRSIEDKTTKHQNRPNNNQSQSKKNTNNSVQEKNVKENVPTKDDESMSGRTRRRRSAIAT